MVLSVTSLFLFHSLSYTFYTVLSPSSSHICMNDVCISSISSKNGCTKTKEGRGTKGLCGERGCHSHMLAATLLFVLPRTVPKLDFCFYIVDLTGQSLAAAVSPLSSKLWWVTCDCTMLDHADWSSSYLLMNLIGIFHKHNDVIHRRQGTDKGMWTIQRTVLFKFNFFISASN